VPLRPTLYMVPGRAVAPGGDGLLISQAARRGEPVPAQATSVLCRAENQTAAPERCRPNHAVLLARWLDWRQLLIVVRPETLVQWHRQGFRLFWRSKSQRPGRPRIPVSLQELIAHMAQANRTWGEERIAAELLLKLGIALSPRTVSRYMRRPRRSRRVYRRKRGARLCRTMPAKPWRATSS